ncbi:hypothetical protein LguiB_019049 [Lonicera macranthoides]
MDQWKTTKDRSEPLFVNSVPTNAFHHNAYPQLRQGTEVQDAVTARKLQKAVQEKWRRDRLHEQFVELENVLDRGRPNKDKETLMSDTIETLLGLTDEINKLKAESAMLSEQSRELTREKNELIEETASLKSEIGNLKIQYQQRLMVMRPWPTIDPTVVIAPMPYSFPVAVPVPLAQIPVHPFMRPIPFVGIRNPGPIPNAHSTFISYPATTYASTSQISSIGSKSSNHCWGCDIENDCDSNDQDTLLELKTPGSPSREEFTPQDRKGKRPLIEEKSRKHERLSSRNLD